MELLDQISHSELSSAVAKIRSKRPKILVVGDVMLDHYRIGEAVRISPEAPVPILLNPREEFRLGGAAAVGAMCAALGAEVALIGTVGDDASGERLLKQLADYDVSFAGLVTADRVTTTKERICGIASGRHRQQLGRIDTEDDRPLPIQIQRVLCDTIQGTVDDPAGALLVADYAKGVVTPEVAAACRDACHLTIADPPRNGNWDMYWQFSCVVPNREEARDQSARQIRVALKTQAAIVKLDQDGCELNETGILDQSVRLGALARSVHDVTGAGDQFLAVLGCLRACGADWHQAAELANVAAGMQVERQGCVPVTFEELIWEISSDSRTTTNESGTSGTTRVVLAAAG